MSNLRRNIYILSITHFKSYLIAKWNKWSAVQKNQSTMTVPSMRYRTPLEACICKCGQCMFQDQVHIRQWCMFRWGEMRKGSRAGISDRVGRGWVLTSFIPMILAPPSSSRVTRAHSGFDSSLPFRGLNVTDFPESNVS